MKRQKEQSAFTLVELLVVSAIILVLASLLLGVGRRLLTQAQEKLARSTIDIVVTAVEQYHSEMNRFPMEYLNSQQVSVTANFPQSKIQASDPFGLTDYLKDDLGLNRMTPAGTLTILPAAPIRDEYAVCECLYYFLRQCPASRRIIDTITDSQKTSLDPTRKPRQAEYTYQDPTGQSVKATLTLIRLIDPWGISLRYEYSPVSMSFPRIISAGPDKTFDTSDDLRSDTAK